MSDGPIIGQDDLDQFRLGFSRGKPTKILTPEPWQLVDEGDQVYFRSGGTILPFTPENARRIYAENQVKGAGTGIFRPFIRLGSAVSNLLGGSNQPIPNFPKPVDMPIERYQELRNRLMMSR